jgi:glycosyltransferase involved in cell wall biosynthesis
VRVLVYPHTLDVGGSQLNAIELAAAIRDRGHGAVVYARPGPLLDRVHELGLRFVEPPAARRRPSPSIARHLYDLVRRERIDVVHAYEWPSTVEAFYGPRLLGNRAVVGTVLSMAVAPFLPATLPLIVGTAQIAAATPRTGGPMHVLEPTVDTELNHPGIDGAAFRAAHGLDGGPPLAVVVSRLVPDLKQEGLERTVDAVDVLGDGFPVQLAIVGGGPAHADLRARADRVNARLGRRAVLLTGELLDPRPAYAAADLVIGMGSSILRGMAFAKPAVVLGEAGFSEVLTPDSIETFLWQGFYGLGDGDTDPNRLADQIRSVLGDAARRDALARFAHDVVRRRFALVRAGAILEEVYAGELARARRRRDAARDVIGTGRGVTSHKLARRRDRRSGAGSGSADEFNARTVLERVAAVAPPWAG